MFLLRHLSGLPPRFCNLPAA